ncbi:MAG: hypothetical protein EZS28_053201, partial [Streblomastix strix]
PSNQPQNSSHYGFADFVSEEDAYWAFEYGKGKIIRGKELQIQQCSNQQTQILHEPQHINHEHLHPSNNTSNVTSNIPSNVTSNVTSNNPSNVTSNVTSNIPSNVTSNNTSNIPSNVTPNTLHNANLYIPLDPPPNFPIVPSNKTIVTPNTLNPTLVHNAPSVQQIYTIQLKINNLDVSIKDIKSLLAQFQPYKVSTCEDLSQNNSLIATIEFANSELATNAVKFAQCQYLKGKIISAELLKPFNKC